MLSTRFEDLQNDTSKMDKHNWLSTPDSKVSHIVLHNPVPQICIMLSQVEVFWVVMPCNVVVGYQSFGAASIFRVKCIALNSAGAHTQIQNLFLCKKFQE
jgi:hypothetical protein